LLLAAIDVRKTDERVCFEKKTSFQKGELTEIVVNVETAFLLYSFRQHMM
jgi:hypothetical protein